MKKTLRYIRTFAGQTGLVFIFLTLVFTAGNGAIAQPGSQIFKDEFNGNALSGNWIRNDYWSAYGGFAYSASDWGALTTSKKYTDQSFIIETAAKGFTPSYWREFRIAFGQTGPEDQRTYVITYGPDSGGRIILGKSTDNIYYPETLDAASIYPQLAKDKLYKFKIARYQSGLIQVYLDQGAGYGDVPLLEAIDKSYPTLGHFSWQVTTQTAPEIFYVDRAEARVADTEKPAVREKPAADDLITQVAASSGRSYKVGKLSAGSQLYIDRSFMATTVPSYLKGASFIQTAMEDKKETETFELVTFLRKPAVVYVAYDARATSLPAWLAGWHKTGDVIGTNDPKMPRMLVYSKSADYWQLFPRPFVLKGNMAGPAEGAQSNYIVVAVETPATERLEAENAMLSGPRVARDHMGFSGTGFADYINNDKDFIEWTADVKVPGTYNVGFQFSNGSGKSRTLAFSIDQGAPQNIPFVPITSWDNWATYSGPRVYLKPGVHKFRATATGQSGPNIDFMSLSYFDAGLEANPLALARTGAPEAYSLAGTGESAPTAFPNPFEGRAVISYELSEQSAVNLSIYSTYGKIETVLVDKVLDAGKYETEFAGTHFPSGTYVYRLQRGGSVMVGKIVKK